MTIDIDAIRRRELAATPAPWGVGNGTFVASELKQLDNGSIQYRYAVAELDEFAREEGDYPNSVTPEADAEFIAHARTDIPALCDEIEQLRAALAKTRRERDEYAADNTRVAVSLVDVQRQLTAANHHTDGLAADVRDMQKANTAYANENARLRSKLADADEADKAEVSR